MFALRGKIQIFFIKKPGFSTQCKHPTNQMPFLGSGPDRGRSPVEWGNFLSVHPFIRSSPLWAIQSGLKPSQPGTRPIQSGIRPSLAYLTPRQPARPQASDLVGWASCLAGWPRGGNGRTNGRTDGKSPNSTGLCPSSAVLLPPKRTKEGREGQGNR